MIIETEYSVCASFGCGKRLTPQETLLGNVCANHSGPAIKLINKKQMKFNIATAKSRVDKKLQNKEFTWDAFLNKIREPNMTQETAAEYAAFNKRRQDETKDVGGFVGGYLSSGRRLATSIVRRSIITLDVDNAQNDFWDKFCLLFECSAALYSTHKHTPESPRYRLIIPLSREVFIDEYAAICRLIASKLGIEQFDPTGYQPHRLMYWPSVSKNSEYIFQEQRGYLLPPDEILSEYENWQNISEWPRGTEEKKYIAATAKKQGDPLEKPGLIGAFNRAWPIEAAIEKYLPEIYEKSGVQNRYTYKKGSTSGGAIVYDDKFIFSHHSTDPTCEILCNAFDLVRLHKFGLLDLESEAPVNKKPSYLAMCDFVASDPDIKQQIGQAKIEESRLAFKDVAAITKNSAGNLEWLKEMDVDRKGRYVVTINNIALILEHDPIFAGNLAFDDFKKQAVFCRDLPWRSIKKQPLLTDKDLANIENYIEKVYKIACNGKLERGLLVVLEKFTFHPIVNFITGLKWDGQPRVDTLLIDYLGAENTQYTREATRKSLVACVARVVQPGIKFDYVLTLIGDEGQGKSQLLDRLGGEWFSDTFNMQMLKGKEAYEQIQGFWIIEIGELSGMAKADVERVKGFIAARKDAYRAPYARTIEDRPRQCVFFATSNDFSPLRSQTGNRRFWPVSTYETTPVKNIFKITKDEIEQIWAEVFAIYKKGEALYLDARMTQIAKIVQANYTEENPLHDMIESYLQYKIPENWYKMIKWEKKEFIENYDENREDIFDRTTICIYEIWEMVMDKKEHITPYGAKIIKQTMRDFPDWRKINEAVRFGIHYPRHKGSYAKVVKWEEILE